VFVHRLQRVPHVEKCIRSTAATRTVYVTNRGRSFPHSLLLQKQLCKMRDAHYLVNLRRQNVKVISRCEEFHYRVSNFK